MTNRLAIDIVKDLSNNNVSDNERALAIYQVMNMPTLMSVTKAEMVNVIRWLWHQAFRFETEEKDGAE